jgi:hypothetical protein
MIYSRHNMAAKFFIWFYALFTNTQVVLYYFTVLVIQMKMSSQYLLLFISAASMFNILSLYKIRHYIFLFL